MKRFRIGGEQETDSINTANALMLLSRNEEAISMNHKRVFECGACNKRFHSFQALGGHRASHKKPRLSDDEQRQTQSAVSKPRVHGCPICGVEFAIGQALGGHMRRHRASTNRGFDHGQIVEKSFNGKRGLLLDLNLPPLVDDSEGRDWGLGFGLGLGLEYVDKTPMVDCFR